MKKWTKRILKVLLVGVLLAAILDLGIHLVSRTEWFNRQLETALTQALGREVQLGAMGANLRSVFVRDVHIAEKGGFEQGTFAQAGLLRIRVSLGHLLHGHLQVQSLILSDTLVRLTTYSDGTASWADLTVSEEQVKSEGQAAESTDNSFELTAKHIRLERLRLIYTDQRTPRTLDISGLTLDIKNFSLDQAFPVTLFTELLHTENDWERRIPLTLKAEVYFNQLDLDNAYVRIRALKAFYQKSSLTLNGTVTDFTNPHVDATMTLRNFSSDLLDGILSLPNIRLDQATAAVKLDAHLDEQSLTLHRASLKAPGIDLMLSGDLHYKDKLRYKVSAAMMLVLGEIGRWFPVLADPYSLVGSLEGQLTATQDKAEATVTLQQVGALVPQTGRLADMNGTISAWETMDFKTGSAQVDIQGKLNANPFQLNLSANQTPQQIKAVLDMYAKEFILPAFKQTTSKPTATPAQQEVSPTAWSLPPIHLISNVRLGSVDVPYFTGKDIVFTSDLKGITPDLNQAHGTLRLTTGTGKIQDIYKLTDANPLTKVLFLSLNVTGKVFNSLNVLGVLDSLGSGIISAVISDDDEEQKDVKTQTILGPDGEPLEVVVTDSDKKVSGEMDYDKFDTEVNFVEGLATVKKGTFVSPMMSFRLDGTADFNSGDLDMTVHAAPGRHEVDGMMPLSLKIGGTIDDPQGRMQMLGSVTSLVTQSVTNNVVSRNVTKGIKGLFGLFKKKEPAP